jgi:LysM repeat protein
MRGIVDKLILLVALAIPLVILGVGLPTLSGTMAPASTTNVNEPLLPSPAPASDTAAPSARPSLPLDATPPPTLVPPTRAVPEPTPIAQAAEPVEVVKPTAAVIQSTRVAGRRTYTVQRGDELKEIAAAHGVSMASIVAINDIPDPDSLRVGQVLTIPDPPR